MLLSTCKDKKLRLFDPRASAAAVTVADSHSGIKGSRVAWMGALDRIVTTGFSRTSERQVYVWDSRELTKGPIKTITIDQSSGTLMPFWNAGNKSVWAVLFASHLADRSTLQHPLPRWQGVSRRVVCRLDRDPDPCPRRDGNVRYYEYENDDLFYL